MGIEISAKFSWAKTPQSLSEELMHLSTLIEDSYGYMKGTKTLLVEMEETRTLR
jgi:hypothetical protein